MNYQTPLTANHPGTRDWWIQRVTAVALLPLTLWAVKFLNLCVTAAYPETLSWLGQPLNSAGILTWILVVCYHAALGLHVVIEDYIAVPGQNLIALWTVNLAFLFMALTATLAVIRILTLG